jgi:predicted nucleotidyltransferase
MHKDLTQAFNKIVDIIKEDKRCLGGWHFGSVGRGTADEHSDYDAVFLISGKDIESFAADIPNVISEVSDEVVVGFDEGFNNGIFKCFCYALKIGGNIHQFDVFIMNNDHPEDWMCKLHLTGCTPEHIFFDRTGETAELLSKGYRIDNNASFTRAGYSEDEALRLLLSRTFLGIMKTLSDCTKLSLTFV